MEPQFTTQASGGRTNTSRRKDKVMIRAKLTGPGAGLLEPGNVKAGSMKLVIQAQSAHTCPTTNVQITIGAIEGQNIQGGQPAMKSCNWGQAW